jgi:hypothetical protein
MTENIPALIAAYRGIRDWQERVAPSASADEMEELKPHLNALERALESLSAPAATDDERDALLAFIDANRPETATGADRLRDQGFDEVLSLIIRFYAKAREALSTSAPTTLCGERGCVFTSHASGPHSWEAQ